MASVTPQRKNAVKYNPVLMKEVIFNTSDIVKAVDGYLLVGGEGAELLPPSLQEACKLNLS
jgi:hypothetical protein